LLKVLSRITRPTEGKAFIYGRVGSLLEVGTGFNLELSGRENIFLNGAILGMRREEIKRKFDAIVEFAEVDRFIDTPVKRYSSGMYVRLAFAIAAHMEQEILIIDEVLAVGDADFQKKCLGKMKDLSSGGRTILFVSHNSSAIANLCNRGIVLEKGRVRFDGTSAAALQLYGSELNRQSYVGEISANRPSITRVDVDDSALSRGSLRVSIGFASPFELAPPIVGLVVQSLYGTPLFGTNARMHSDGFKGRPMKSGTAVLTVDHLRLHSGSYKISVWLGDRREDYDKRLDAVTFDYISPEFVPNMPPLDVIGPFDVRGQWRLEENEGADPSYGP
jgi:lipopolysaccharide transport system ATP-binding protein